MAKPVSSLESHPQRDRIIDALASGRPYSEIEAWTQPPVNRGALSRFKSRAIAVQSRAVKSARAAIENAIAYKGNELDGAVQDAMQRAALVVAIDPFIARVAQLDADRTRIKGKAEDAGDLRTWVSADRNDLTALELHARLAGRLDNAQTNVSIAIVCPAAERAEPAWEGVTVDIASK